jgi:DNA-directed RNA polymerase specialized sigma24 family protein
MFNSNKQRDDYWQSLSGEQLEKALQTLNDDTRLVLLLYFGEERSFRYIADIMRLSLTVIRTHHSRGVYKIYRYFNPRPNPPKVGTATVYTRNAF